MLYLMRTVKQKNLRDEYWCLVEWWSPTTCQHVDYRIRSVSSNLQFSLSLPSLPYVLEVMNHHTKVLHFKTNTSVPPDVVKKPHQVNFNLKCVDPASDDFQVQVRRFLCVLESVGDFHHQVLTHSKTELVYKFVCITIWFGWVLLTFQCFCWDLAFWSSKLAWVLSFWSGILCTSISSQSCICYTMVLYWFLVVQYRQWWLC